MDARPPQPTTLDQLIFRAPGQPHAVVSCSLLPAQLRLAIAPWSNLSDRVLLEFADVALRSWEVYGDPSEDLHVPWDLLGVAATPIGAERWHVVLTTTTVEFGFEARWPRVVHPEQP